MVKIHRNGIDFIISNLTLNFNIATINAYKQTSRIAEKYDLDINYKANNFTKGKASISGIASINSFFNAAIDLNTSMLDLSSSLHAKLNAIKTSIDLKPNANRADLQSAINAHLEAYINVDTDLSITYQPAKYQTNIEASVTTAAKYDVEVKPSIVSAKYSETCRADASVDTNCNGKAEVICSNTAPNFTYEGSYSSSCTMELTTTANCEGTCHKSCTANDSTMDNFNSQCTDECEGECVADLSTDNSYEDRCKGNCEYTPPSDICEANASLSCHTINEASIKCEDDCEGKVKPPEISTECEASVEAKANASVKYTPPTLTFDFK